MLQLWRNPEFIRHCRSELRRNRATAVAAVVLAICALTIMACWAEEQSRLGTMQAGLHSTAPIRTRAYVEDFAQNLAKTTAQDSYQWLLLMQFGVVTFWSLLAGAQAVSRERERGTWDFQRITRSPLQNFCWASFLVNPFLRTSLSCVACRFRWC